MNKAKILYKILIWIFGLSFSLLIYLDISSQKQFIDLLKESYFITSINAFTSLYFVVCGLLIFVCTTIFDELTGLMNERRYKK